MTDESGRFVVAAGELPDGWPTHLHDAAFWEALGRTVATFGFLEETLGKAIFAFTATREYSQTEVQTAYQSWLPTLERALSDPLGGLIDAYGKAVRNHPKSTLTNLDELTGDLRRAAALRNALCHGSWRPPDDQGRSIPLYMTKRNELFATRVDVRYLNEVRAHVVELICAVMNTVTHMGWQFPGSRGPGEKILDASRS